ncbi:MAG: lysophospholipid acyltransferase family protein [Pseudomonadota bacterium]
MIRSTIFNVVFYSFSFGIAMTCWVIAHVSTRDRMWNVLNFWGRSVLWLVRVILGSRVEVRGLEHLDLTRSQLIVAKHQSELDIVMLGALMRDISAVAMEELTKLPFFGTILKTVGTVNIAVDRGPQGRTEMMIEGAKRIRAENRTMIIYPEGELMKLGAKERYKSGAGHLYQAMHVEAVPVAVSLGVIWPQREWRKHCNQTGAIEFMEPIPPGKPFEAFMEEIEERIEGRTMELIEEHASGQVLEDARRRQARGSDNAD